MAGCFAVAVAVVVGCRACALCCSVALRGRGFATTPQSRSGGGEAAEIAVEPAAKQSIETPGPPAAAATAAVAPQGCSAPL